MSADMKTLSCLLLAFSATVLADPADDYVNFIRQTQADTGVEWDVSVASSGESLSPEGVGKEGSFFQLWAIHSPTANQYMLDEQYVSSYLPTAKIVIITGDPYTSVARTRVDQPFSVRITVDGLDDGTSGLLPEDIPEAALNVAFSHSVVNYPEGSHALPTGSAIEPAMIREGYITENGYAIVTYSMTNLSGADLTQVEGEETFTMTSLADYGIAASVLDSKRLQIWPVATGAISGLDPTKRYTDIPPITVTLDDLYPASETFVRFYKGAPASSPSDPKMLQGSYVLLADSIPQARNLTITNVNRFFKKEGPYTLEIIHETPFGFDILDQFYPLLVDRTIEMKGSLFTRE
jgi:hypothetical protein